MIRFLRWLAAIFVIIIPPFLAWGCFVRPILYTLRSQNWVQSQTLTLSVSEKSQHGKAHTGIRYTFQTLDGIQRGDDLSFWPGSYRATIDPRVDGAASARVWYDPGDPRLSVLFREIDVPSCLFGLIPCAFSVLSMYLLFSLLHRFARRVKIAE